ncbi:MAG: hypothetical protein H6888_13605 [Nitratireductor sp.]|nr:hypothetical protein [Nitratireductor sp.]
MPLLDQRNLLPDRIAGMKTRAQAGSGIRMIRIRSSSPRIDMQYHPLAAILRITADNEYAVYLNGGMIGEDTGDSASVWNRAESYDIAPYLRCKKRDRDRCPRLWRRLDCSLMLTLRPSTLPGQANGGTRPTGQLAWPLPVDTSVNGASYPSGGPDNRQRTDHRHVRRMGCCPVRVSTRLPLRFRKQVMIERDCSRRRHVGPCKQTYDSSIMNGRLEGTLPAPVIGAAQAGYCLLII